MANCLPQNRIFPVKQLVSHLLKSFEHNCLQNRKALSFSLLFQLNVQLALEVLIVVWSVPVIRLDIILTYICRTYSRAALSARDLLILATR